MTTATTAKPALSTVQLLDQQKKRLAELQERRTRAKVRLETEQENLAAAKKEAEALFNTSDIAALRQLYKDLQTTNERLVVEFTQALDDAEQRLSDIERQIKL